MPRIRFICVRSLLLLVCVIVAAPVARLTAADESRPPNIIFIMLDDLGYGELGCYGQEKIQTPRIDRMAAEGMRFTQCYAGANVCAPSRSVLMTGLHTGHTPIRANGGGKFLYPEDVTIAEDLKQRGYATGGFGKWGLGVQGTPGHPNRQGFDLFFGQLHQVHAHFYYPYFLYRNESKFFLPENEGRKQERYAHDVIHEQALDFIREHHTAPFFCYLPYIIPHVELTVPEDSLAPYRGKFPETPLPDPREGYLGADEPYATFAGMVSRVDRHVGEILDLLSELKIDEHTVVFLTSDNGGQGGPWQRMTDFFDGNGGLRGYKGQFYEGGIRVPLIARWPGRIKRGSQTSHVCAFWDVLPTLAEIGGADAPDNLDGLSFVPTLLDKPIQREHLYLYWEHPRGSRFDQAVRLQEWKGVKNTGQDWELYNLDKDEQESLNVASDHPEVLAKIKQFAAEAHTEPRDYPPEKQRKTHKDYVR